jgi:small-conductance mechanosensitive channel
VDLQRFVSSLKRFVLSLAALVVLTLVSVFLFDWLIAGQIGLPDLLRQTGRALIVVVFGLLIILSIGRSKHLLSRHVGVHPATVFQFFMILIVSIVMIFAFLNIFNVSASNLLISGGIVTIVIGLVISTFVGNILAGTLVLMTRPFKVGDTVLVNNIPGKVEEITAMATKVRNDIGGRVVIPNTAIMQGGVIITSFSGHDAEAMTRLPYCSGDRIYTTYLSQEGVVLEITPFYTKILLDSGKELTFLNTSVLTGTVAVAKIHEKAH